jgi:hypothetical protein
MSNIGSGSASRFDLLNVDLRSRPLLDRGRMPAGSDCHLVVQAFQSAIREFGCQAIVVVDRKMCRCKGQFFAIKLVARSASGTEDFEGSATCIPYARCAIVSALKGVCARSAVSSCTSLFCDTDAYSSIIPCIGISG